MDYILAIWQPSYSKYPIMKSAIFKRRFNFLDRMSSTASDGGKMQSCLFQSYDPDLSIPMQVSWFLTIWPSVLAMWPRASKSHALSSFVHASYRKLDTGSPGCYTTQTITTLFVLQAVTERYFWLLSRLVYHKMPQVVSTVLQQFPNAQGLLIGKREPQFNCWQRDRAHRNNECGCGRDHSGEYFLSIGFKDCYVDLQSLTCLRAKSDDQERAGRLLTNAKGSLKITLNTAADNVIDDLWSDFSVNAV